MRRILRLSSLGHQSLLRVPLPAPWLSSPLRKGHLAASAIGSKFIPEVLCCRTWVPRKVPSRDTKVIRRLDRQCILYRMSRTGLPQPMPLIEREEKKPDQLGRALGAERPRFELGDQKIGHSLAGCCITTLPPLQESSASSRAFASCGRAKIVKSFLSPRHKLKEFVSWLQNTGSGVFFNR